MRRSQRQFFCTLCLLVSLVGCSQQRKPVLPGTGTIPLKVWVVLGPGESIGNTSNKGCRLSLVQMRNRIEKLQDHTYIFGSNIAFQWLPNTPTEAQDPALLPFQSRDRPELNWHQTVVSNYWQADHLNIYFTGNVQSYGQDVVAMTLDPSGAISWTPERPWIVLNDCGFGQSSGFASGFSPSQVITFIVVEHEMAHYLLRRIGIPPYDSGEHVPNGQNNILQGGGVGPQEGPYPLVVPGRWNKADTEQKEIWDRVYAGLWNNP